MGVQVMLLKNMSGSLVNGSMGKIIGFRSYGDGEKLPMVRFDNDEIQTIGQDLWEYKVGDIQQASRIQLPLRLAWALSIHKSQGQTIKYLCVDIGKSFTTGMVYVALSRGTHLAGIE
ncbi:hypothetical protein BC936DRAFT_138015, partial [Jimgerdemannia flammicorona]